MARPPALGTHHLRTCPVVQLPHPWLPCHRLAPARTCVEPSSEVTALGSAPSLPPMNHLSGPYLLSSVPHTLRGPGQSVFGGVFLPRPQVPLGPEQGPALQGVLSPIAPWRGVCQLLLEGKDVTVLSRPFLVARSKQNQRPYLGHRQREASQGVGNAWYLSLRSQRQGPHSPAPPP